MRNPEIDVDVVKSVIRDPYRYGLTRCALCSEPAGPRKGFEIGIFSPSARFAARIGARTRLVFYLLCGQCVKLPDKVDRVEDGMLRDLGHIHN